MSTARYAIHAPDTITLYLRSLRHLRGWTQADMARQLGVSVARYSAIERAPGRVQAAQLLAALRILGARLTIEVPSTRTTVAETREEW